jgi:lipid-binding SYLF domain-containing protein
MPRLAQAVAFVALFTLLFSPRSACGQYLEEETVRAAAGVLSETMASPLNGVPQSMLANAYGVAIIPNVIKGSFIVGARHGRGVLLVREPEGEWHAPVFVTLTGGNVGWQVGVQSSDIVLVFKTLRSVQGILAGKLTIGADAAAAAGPVGRQGAVATDGRLQAEIYSYSRSRGLFAGVSIDGSVLQIDKLSTGQYYRSPGPGQPVVVPPSAQQLTQAIVNYSGGSAPTGAPNQSPMLAQQYGISESEVLRSQIVQLAPQLFELLDPQWTSYLALPSSLLIDGAQTSQQDLQATLAHYNTVATDARFQQLAARPEFQSIHGLLKHYQQSLSGISAAVQLPPPPSSEVLPQ